MGALPIVLNLLLVLVLSCGIDGQTTIPSSTLDPDTPVSSFACTFENGTCYLRQSTDDDFDWIRQSGPTTTDQTGPAVDHTTGNSEGFYMYADASAPQGLGDKCALNSPVITSGGVRCLEFYYNMYGIQLGSLQVHYLNTDDSTAEPVQLWRISGTQGEPWHRALVNVDASTNNFRLIFQATIGTHHQGDIAIDDITLSYGVCPYERLPCDFEDSSQCGYSHDPTTSVRMRRSSGSTPSLYTGPSEDHTYGNSSGYYMYLETSGLREGMLSRLISPVLAGSEDGNNCLILWYHMYGQAVDSLSVYAWNVSDRDLGRPLWTIRGNRGNLWRATEIDLGFRMDFQIVIEMTASGDYRGDIAVDDVMVTGLKCPGEYVNTNTSGVTCTFESPEICYYTQDKTDDLDWTWQNSATRDHFTGPDNDHTLGSNLGFYLVFSGNPGRGQFLARLISPAIPPTSATSCIEFWYHMYGDDVEVLNVYVVIATYTNLPDTPAWTMTGNQGNYWHRATVSFPRSAVQMKLVFEARNGLQERDDIAIDDVTLYASASCPEFVTDAPPPTTRPIPIDDIGCDFEIDFCNYSQAIDDIFDWTRHQGPTSSRGSGPDVDHTTGTNQGYYALMDCSNSILRFDDRARLISPLLGASSSPRCFKFFYHKYSTNSRTQDYLNLYIKEWGHRLGFDPDWTIYGVQGQEWIEGMLDIPPSTNPVQVVIEGSIAYYSYYCDIAVDDISIEAGACPIVPGGPDGSDDVNCDFEGDDPWCGYEQGGLNNAGDDKMDWIINTGPTGTDGTGPSNDHTYGTSDGHYIYVESSQPQRPGDNAVITSPKLLTSFDHMCLQFYYHMSGVDTAWLRVYVTLDNEDSKEIARINGQRNAEWTPSLIDIPPFRGGLKISFEGKVGQGFLGDIAIDDITTYREPCGGFPQGTFCEFEFGFDACMYDFQNTDDMKQWRWFDEYSGSSPVAPVSGSFMYTSGSGSSGRTAAISSNRFKLNELPHCVIFLYFIDGPSTSLLVNLELSNGTKVELTTLTEATSGEWAIFGKDVGLYQDHSVKINFIGTTSTSSIIAVDDVGAIAGNCKALYDMYGGKPPTSQPEPVGKSKAGMIIGIIFAILVVLVIVAGVVWFLKSRRGSPNMNFRFDNGKDPQLTSSKDLSTDPGIANPNYGEAKLTTA